MFSFSNLVIAFPVICYIYRHSPTPSDLLPYNVLFGRICPNARRVDVGIGNFFKKSFSGCRQVIDIFSVIDFEMTEKYKSFWSECLKILTEKPCYGKF